MVLRSVPTNFDIRDLAREPGYKDCAGVSADVGCQRIFSTKTATRTNPRFRHSTRGPRNATKQCKTSTHPSYRN
jgi:hypothetical protein